jgi:hypothetical protein
VSRRDTTGAASRRACASARSVERRFDQSASSCRRSEPSRRLDLQREYGTGWSPSGHHLVTTTAASNACESRSEVPTGAQRIIGLVGSGWWCGCGGAVARCALRGVSPGVPGGRSSLRPAVSGMVFFGGDQVDAINGTTTPASADMNARSERWTERSWPLKHWEWRWTIRRWPIRSVWPTPWPKPVGR